MLTKEGVFVRFIGSADESSGGYLVHPTDVAVDEEHVFVTSNNCIKVFAKEGGAFVREVRRAAADGMREGNPNYLALGGDGCLYATDCRNQCVSVFEG